MRKSSLLEKVGGDLGVLPCCWGDVAHKPAVEADWDKSFLATARPSPCQNSGPASPYQCGLWTGVKSDSQSLAMVASLHPYDANICIESTVCRPLCPEHKDGRMWLGILYTWCEFCSAPSWVFVRFKI